MHRLALAVGALMALAPAANAAPCAPPLRPRIAEVFYDAAGDDSGREFVEFFNPHSVTLALAGAKLEVGDGSGPGRWSVRWTGGPSDSLVAGGRLVVGGALVDAVPKALAALDLQNGPDAVRVTWPDGTHEVVGYGALEHAEYFCGAPAADVASGQSLARLPDDADQGGNAADFRAAAPSPGRPNQRRRDAALVAGASRIVPDLPAPGAPARLTAVVENRGIEPLPSELAVVAFEAGGAEPLASGRLGQALAPAETASVALDLPGLAAGKRRVRIAASLPGDEAPENDGDSLWVRVGAGPLQLTEVQFHPTGGEGEWVEVVNASAEPLDLATHRFTDRGGAPGVPAAGAPLPPDSLAVLAQSRAALLLRFPRLDTTRVREVRPWPSLNNSDDATGVADVAALVDGDGTPCDRLAYSAAAVPNGVPLERDANGFWSPSPSVAGSPLEPPRPPSRVEGRFQIEPRRLALGGASARLRWDLPWARARVALDLFDLAGRPRGQVLAEAAGSGRGEHLWVPRDLGPGLYLLVLRARAEGGDGRVALTRAIRLEAR